MKPVTKRILASALILIITLSCLTAFGISKTRAEETEYKEFSKILMFGDSVSTGYGHQDMYFANAVADELGIGKRFIPHKKANQENGYINYVWKNDYKLRFDINTIENTDRIYFGFASMRSTEALIALGGAEINYDDPYYKPDSTDCCPNNIADTAYYNSEYFREAVRQSDLIIIELGINDVYYYAQGCSGIEKELDNLENLNFIDFIKRYTGLLKEGYNAFTENFPKIIETIQELKGDSEYSLCVCGVYNPINGITLSDDFPLQIGGIGAVISTMMNKKYKEWADRYGFNYIDIADVPLASMTDDISVVDLTELDRAGVASHPKYSVGYDYIARRILASLVKEERPADYNVRIDLGSATSVDKVYINGKQLSDSDFSFDSVSNVLTVYQEKPVAITCAITSKRENNRIYTAFYLLSYNKNDGYDSSLIYQINDFDNTVTKFATGFISAIKTCLQMVKGLIFK